MPHHVHSHLTYTHPVNSTETIIGTELPFAFRVTFRGGAMMCLPESDLKALPPAVVVTYRIREIVAVEIGELFECVMDGSDGSSLRFKLTAADLAHNMTLAREHRENSGLLLAA